jgi:dCMP deaminase
MIIIGLTGENCSGKGTFADYLVKKGFVFISLSDVIREALVADGKEITRENLIEKGNELRKRSGPGVLAKMVLLKVKGDANCVIDSIRNPAEVDELRKRKGFFLVHVTASPEIRFERMKKRGREGDPKTLEAFLKIEAAEAKNPDATQQQVLATVRMADKKVPNDGGLQEFYEGIDAILGQISKQFKVSRPSWDDYFMSIAKAVSTRSNCMKRQVGAIIVQDKRIVSTGYNGTPRGLRNCNEGGCPRCNSFSASGTKLEECLCSHAEENAIVQAAYHGIGIKGATLYTTLSPCVMCTKMILNGGIVEVVYNAKYALDDTTGRLFREAGVALKQVEV